MLTLYIGNKNYSSWSLRPWLVLMHFGIEFVEQKVAIGGRGPHKDHKAYSGNGLVPCLHIDGFPVWDSLAIMETLAERYPDLGLWPQEAHARARARSISAEMHAGFSALRTAMPMNIKEAYQGISTYPEAVQNDLDRIIEIWTETPAVFGKGQGPYLFGLFSIADAMFAPLAWRFHTYHVTLPKAAAQYQAALLQHPAMQAWAKGARAETTSLPYDARASEYGGRR